jgi:hypothetical protein
VEAAKLGFTTVIVPALHAPSAAGRLAGVRILKCRTIRDALQAALGTRVMQKEQQQQPDLETGTEAGNEEESLGML